MLIYKIANAQEINTSLNLNISGLIDAIFIFLNDFLSEVYPLLTLLLGLLLGFYIIKRIIFMFVSTESITDQTKTELAGNTQKQKTERPEKIKEIDDFAHYEEEEEFPDDWQDRPDWLKS